MKNFFVSSRTRFPVLVCLEDIAAVRVKKRKAGGWYIIIILNNGSIVNCRYDCWLDEAERDWNRLTRALLGEVDNGKST